MRTSAFETAGILSTSRTKMRFIATVFLVGILSSSAVQASKVQMNAKGTVRSWHRRTKRSLLILSGTKWCGKGNEANHFNDLGPHHKADKCCRIHDQCNVTIGPWETRFDRFNYRLYTVSECSCDNRLEKCLLAAGTPAAAKVYKLFFKSLRIPCFRLTQRRRRICIERTWYFSCSRYSTVTEYVAHWVYS